ncbi:unnamed protein product [Protopolystoma xenopodis]|uniref:Uncharacterized protein n=1 Tax=Protopolystoma xenopodis TaxID=117903 RepID=A0A448WJL7_9PLAT|nr:unnamed protein product [Protopolystoma xenopodis]
MRVVISLPSLLFVFRYLGSNAASAKASLMTSSSSGTPSFRQENLAPGQFLSDTSHSQEPTSPEPESHSSQGQNGLENSVCDLPNSIDPHLRISSINDVKPSAAKSSGSRPALDRRRRFGTVQQPASLLEISAMAAAEAAVTASIGVTTCESPLAPPSSETTIVGLDSIGAGTRFCQLSSSPCISPGRPLPPSSASRHLDTRATVLPTSAIHFYQHQKRHLPSPTASAGLLLPLRFTKKPEASAVMAPLATDQTCDKELSKNWTETPGLALPRIPDSLVTGQAPLSGTRGRLIFRLQLVFTFGQFICLFKHKLLPIGILQNYRLIFICAFMRMSHTTI